MSRLRPECGTASAKDPTPDTYDALYMIRDAVQRREGLVRGALHKNGGDCAVGAFFNDNPGMALPTDIVDQVAAYNDSVPAHLSNKTRRDMVLQWLNDRLTYLTVGLPRRLAARTKKQPLKKKLQAVA